MDTPGPVVSGATVPAAAALMLLCMVAGAQPLRAEPPALPDPQMLFTDAVAADLGTHGRSDPERAFALYSQAASAGLALAQLNTAVMLDSGRGTRHDAARAATYYALAASQGVARAAYDLGQLYADGEGVPVNADLARAWLRYAAAKGIGAALGRISTLPAASAPAASDAPSAPGPVMPASGAALPRQAGLQLVWTAEAQPATAQFYVEVASLDGAPHDIFTVLTELSAVKGATPRPGRYAWRVFTVCQSLGRYVASPWVAFSIS